MLGKNTERWKKYGKNPYSLKILKIPFGGIKRLCEFIKMIFQVKKKTIISVFCVCLAVFSEKLVLIFRGPEAPEY